jgi:hypothetical protein
LEIRIHTRFNADPGAIAEKRDDMEPVWSTDAMLDAVADAAQRISGVAHAGSPSDPVTSPMS